MPWKILISSDDIKAVTLGVEPSADGNNQCGVNRGVDRNRRTAQAIILSNMGKTEH